MGKEMGKFRTIMTFVMGYHYLIDIFVECFASLFLALLMDCGVEM